MAIRVLIADDHEVVAEGLRHVIEAHPDLDTGLTLVRFALTA